MPERLFEFWLEKVYFGITCSHVQLSASPHG